MTDHAIGDYEIVNAMARYGGHFARAIAEAASRADPENLAKLKAAFPELWQEYANVVAMLAASDAEPENS